MRSEAEDTSARIVDLVEGLIMERGFNAISYRDVSDAIGIRKASVHYHFPSKADLGAAVIRRYVAKLDAVTVPAASLGKSDIAPAFEAFLAMFAEVARQKRVCLGGVLGAEYETLPEPMKTEVRVFYAKAEDWLAEVLQSGLERGVFAFDACAQEIAAAMIAMLEGALIIARAMGEPKPINAALSQARAMAGIVTSA
jgi:TetR/AcrR family transcriptional repressor of nem operon